MNQPSSGDTVETSDVARGAGLAAMARLGALIEVISQPIYTWLFGVATYGIYTVLWAAVNIIENVIDLSMTQALQRVVPAEGNAGAHAAVKFAVIVSIIPAILLAFVITLLAGPIASVISAAADDRAQLPLAIALFAWALPLWTFVEIATSAVRARRAFGPEIRLRIFWEQVARLIFAVGLFAAGLHSIGLLVAHLLSLLLTAILSARLLTRYYDARLLLSAPIDARMRRLLLASGFALLPTAITRRLFVDLPPIILNLMLPGAQGATAAGLFGIARKVASVPLIVRQAFQYVLAPLASAQAALDRSAIGPLYSFSTRLSVAFVVPMTGLIVLIAADILSLFAPEAAAALPLLLILVIGRAIEAVVGPATPIVEMTGHRLLPLVNSAVGLTAWVLLGWLLIPRYGAVGMAIAVSVGTVLTSWVAMIELRVADGITPFDRGSWRSLATALLGVCCLGLLSLTLAPLGARPRAIALLLLFWPMLWLVLRFGLSRSDRGALGSAGRRIGLAAKALA